MTEEEAESNHMPDMYKCDGCLAVGYVIHTMFEEKHRKRHKTWKLDEVDVIEQVGKNHEIFINHIGVVHNYVDRFLDFFATVELLLLLVLKQAVQASNDHFRKR